jgi:hypothetical protein
MNRAPNREYKEREVAFQSRQSKISQRRDETHKVLFARCVCVFRYVILQQNDERDQVTFPHVTNKSSTWLNCVCPMSRKRVQPRTTFDDRPCPSRIKEKAIVPEVLHQANAIFLNLEDVE